jgi:hypothetical protein
MNTPTPPDELAGLREENATMYRLLQDGEMIEKGDVWPYDYKLLPTRQHGFAFQERNHAPHLRLVTSPTQGTAGTLPQTEGREAKLESALKELFAEVNGEAPRLLDDDCGGNGRLYMEIKELLAPAPVSEKGGKEKPLREKSDECPFEVPAFKAPPKKKGKHTLVWWSWHPNYPYWSKSCWGGESVEDALDALNSDFCSSMHYYHNVLVNDETMEVVQDVPCQRMDIWRKYAEPAPAPQPALEGGGK